MYFKNILKLQLAKIYIQHLCLKIIPTFTLIKNDVQNLF